MIRPDRHTHLDYSVINLSSFILKELNAFYSIGYDALLHKVTDMLGHQARENYPYALNFLFLLGKLTYDQTTDSFRYHETK